MSKNLFDTLQVQTIYHPRTLESLVDYLCTHKDLALDDSTVTSMLNTKSFIESPMLQVANKILDYGGQELFTFIAPHERHHHIPELLSFRSIPFDLKQIQDKYAQFDSILSYQRWLNDKIVFNAMPYIRKSDMKVSDIIGLKSQIVRDGLCRSYYNNKKSYWISPPFMLMVAKIFSVAISTTLVTRFRIEDQNLGNVINYILAYYYLGMMSSPHAAAIQLSNNYRKMYLPEPTQQKMLRNWINEITDDGLQSLDDVLTCLEDLNLPRMDVNRMTLINLVRPVFYNDPIICAVTLEYPPLLAWQIFMVMSRMPIPLHFKMKRMGLDKGTMDFLKVVLNTNSLTDTLK